MFYRLKGLFMPSPLRHFAKKISLALLYKSPPFPQKIHGRMMWVHPRARFSVSTKTFFKGEPHGRNWLTAQLRSGDIFFDVGAHHGWVSMWALALVGEKGAVYSFEPSPPNLFILMWHRKANQTGHWEIIPHAVADEDAVQKQFVLIDAGDSPMNSLTTGVPGMPLMDGRNLEKATVQTITLDTFCQEAGVWPDVVKIDVEGAELLVLQGAKRLLEEVCPILIIAVHPYWLPAGQSTANIVSLLTSFGYSVFDSRGNQVEELKSGEYLCSRSNLERRSIQ
jgi:FkbM family methyltransferase